MDITVDTSVVVAVICGEPTSAAAVVATKGHMLVAPMSLHWEVGNALSAMLKRRRLTTAQARTCLAAYRQIPLRFVEIELQDAMDVASRTRAYAYDAYMLICARRTASPLLTFDGALAIHASALGIPLLELGT